MALIVKISGLRVQYDFVQTVQIRLAKEEIEILQHLSNPEAGQAPFLAHP